MIKILVLFIFFLTSIINVFGKEAPKQYEQFDGKYYNNLYYPRIDLIEWGDPPRTYMVINVYQKLNIPVIIDMAFGFKIDKTGPNPKILINYIIKNRGEILCRHTAIPDHFQEGGYKVFVDKTNPELDKFFVTMDPQNFVKKPNTFEIIPTAFKECKEEKEEVKSAVPVPVSKPKLPAVTPIDNSQSGSSDKEEKTEEKKDEKVDETNEIESTVW